MKIKKFTANSLKEGKEKILKDLGEEAVVLSSRTVKDPETGGTLYEIVAAIDDTLVKPVKSEYKRSIRKDSVSGDSGETVSLSSEEQTELLKNTSQIFNEIGSLRDVLNDISDSVKYRYTQPLGPVFGKIYKALVICGFSENFALNITGRISATSPDADLKKAVDEARMLISKNIKTMPPLEKGRKRKIAVFTGTTGSGKTTTLVKLAIIIKLVMEADILLVSADTEKVGGAEQLQTYASIAGIPFKAVYAADELDKVLAEEKERNFIFIDTTGVSQENKEKVKDIKEIVSAAAPDHNFLVISAVTNGSIISSILENFDILSPNAIILSKLDEAPTLGSVIESLKNISLPVAYLTNGQNVPDDLEPADTKTLGNIVLPDKMFESKNGK